MSALVTAAGTARVRAGLAEAHARGYPADLAEALAAQGLGQEKALLAWELVRLAPGLDSEQARGLALVALATLTALDEGSTRVPLDIEDADAYLPRLVRSLGGASRDLESVRAALELARRSDARLAHVIGPPGGRVPLVLDGDHLTSSRMHALEERLVAALTARLERADPDARVERARAALEGLSPTHAGGRAITLSEEQRRAAALALGRPLCVISGGPGTGKTSIVVSILRALARLDPAALSSTALAAPTGRAADRMRRSVTGALRSIEVPGDPDALVLERCPQPRTLHRLLGYSPRADRFAHHRNNRLSEKLLIVDESSMIDVFLMERLVTALTDDARLVLLGDAEQLPSVEAGAVLRDVLAAARSRGCAAELRHSYRMDPADPAGRNILSVADRINRGDAGGLVDEAGPVALRTSPSDLRLEGVELLAVRSFARIPAVLRGWDERRAENLPERPGLVGRVLRGDGRSVAEEDSGTLDALFDHMERFRILTLTRVGAGGTGEEAVNDLMHRRAVRTAPGRTRRPQVGEPVLVTHNDYERGLFNGDQGLVLRVRHGARVQPCAVFRGDAGYRSFPLEQISRGLMLSHAITVHRAQGSEYDHVLLLLPHVQMRLLTRELVYTAVTRARRSVTVAGPPELLVHAADNRIVRSSGIAAALR